MALDRIKQYEITERLGGGAFGTVYRARDTLLERSVVIKLLRGGAGRGDERAERMLEEARLASAIEHPNVCAIYEAGEHEGQPFIVMQYVPGRTLRELLRTGPLGLHFVLSVAIQTAEGLTAAHGLGILHRDLKPENIMIAGGQVKILDFGLARRESPERDAVDERDAPEERGRPVEPPPGDPGSERFGTTAYMAPEQFAVRRSSQQSDIFALGVILYEMITGTHPFRPPKTDRRLVPTLIQGAQPVRPGALREDVPEALDTVVMKALAKQPSNRYRYAQDLAEALKAVMRSLQLETGVVPGELSAVLPSPPDEGSGKRGLLSQLVGRVLPTRGRRAARNSLAVLPFQALDSAEDGRLYGFTLANALATRLARVPGLLVRPLSAYLALSGPLPEGLEAGRELQVERVLLGSFSRAGPGSVVHWQLLDVASRTILAGGTVTVDATELAVVQDRAADEIHSALLAEGHVRETAPSAGPDAPPQELPSDVREQYLTARALLAGFALRSGTRGDLVQARVAYEQVLSRAPAFAPAHAGLGTVYLRSARNGFGGVEHLRAAERHFARALELDPGLVEARLYRASTMIWAGEKESARLGLQQLLESEPPDADIYLAAAVVLQLDGLLEPALRLQGAALRLNPAVAPRAYYYRARVLLFQGKPELARQEIDKGLAIEPGHGLLRHVLGFLHFQQGELDRAIEVVEAVLRKAPSLRIAYPTLAMCYARAGRLADAAALITEELLDAAAADAETAYRLATYLVVIGERDDALDWLRRAIFLGNENHPWFAANPAWAPLHDDPEFQRVMADLEEACRVNRMRWQRVLERLPD